MTFIVEVAVVPAGNVALASFNSLLSQAGVGVDFMESMSDSVAKLASMVRIDGARATVVT